MSVEHLRVVADRKTRNILR